LRRPDLRAYRKAEHDAWERDLIKAIVVYTKKVVGLVQPTKGVYIGIDGIVPMAKMKQQRLRRFKSAWAATTDGEAWSTNAITPGTAFMRLLRTALEKAQGGWRVSSSDEPGEGEHKVMEQMRLFSEPGTHAIYGLDADLVVLSLLTQDTLRRTGVNLSMTLFREEIENGVLTRGEDGEEVFQWFSIDALRALLASTVSVRDYCFAMTLLGNDFLPSSLSLKLREGAHEELMGILSAQTGGLLTAEDDISLDGLTALLTACAAREEERLGRFLQRKASRALPPQALGEETWPLGEQAEAFLLGPTKRLLPSWRAQYRAAFPTSTALYLSGLQWVWNYYRGKEVCYNWYYPWALPPLWSDLEKAVQKGLPPPPPILLRPEEISTSDQLCLVLPPSSYHLLASAKHRAFVAKAPEFFPIEFGFDSVGKQWFWECEAEIPIPSLLEVKRILG